MSALEARFVKLEEVSVRTDMVLGAGILLSYLYLFLEIRKKLKKYEKRC